MWCINGITQQHVKREEQESDENLIKIATKVVHACCVERIILDRIRINVEKEIRKLRSKKTHNKKSDSKDDTRTDASEIICMTKITGDTPEDVHQEKSAQRIRQDACCGA